MTEPDAKEQFIRRHGPRWLAFQRDDPMFADLMVWLRAKDPARATPRIASPLLAETAELHLGEITGANLILNALDHGVELPVEHKDPEATWAEEEVAT